MQYEIGWHSDDDQVCHVALIDHEGNRDDLFDVQLYDPDVEEDGTTARDRSLAKLTELVERANAALGHGCTCDDAHGCGFCFGEAERYIGALIRSEQDHEWIVMSVGEKDDFPILDGEVYWTRPDDVEVLESGHYCQNCAWRGQTSDLKEIKDFHERVMPGEPVPSGECPECGALCQPSFPDAA